MIVLEETIVTMIVAIKFPAFLSPPLLSLPLIPPSPILVPVRRYKYIYLVLRRSVLNMYMYLFIYIYILSLSSPLSQ
jgi:hypothetical protein